MIERPQPFVVRPGEELPAWTSGRAFGVHATSAMTGGALGLWVHDDDPGLGTPMHSHAPDEAFFILSGSFEFYVDEKWLDAPTGSFVFVPGGVAHGFRAGPNGGRKIGLFVPGGNEGLFTDWRSLHDAGTESPEAVAALIERYGVTRLGPLPERS